MIVTIKKISIFSLLGLLTACASLDYGRHNAEAINLAKTGQYEKASKAYEESSKSIFGGKSDILLYYMESGELMRLQNKLPESTDKWRKADEIVEEWESESKITLGKGLRGLGSVVANDAIRRYDGQDYEKTLISARLAMNYLAAGDYKTARIAIVNTGEREQLISQLRTKEIEAAEAEAREKGVRPVLAKDLKGYPYEVLNDPEVNNLRNGYQNAFAWYLAGFVHESLNEPSLATPAYQQAIQIRPDVREARRALNERSGGGGATDVLVVLESGWLPVRKSVTVPIPIPIRTSAPKILSFSFPVFERTYYDSVPQSVNFGGKSVGVEQIANYSAMARRVLKDEMPQMIARTMVRAAVKVGAQVAAEVAGDKLLGKGAGAILSIGVGVAGAVSEVADTRQWNTLPATVSIGRVRLSPGVHILRVGGQTVPVTIRGSHTIVAIRQVGGQFEVLTGNKS